MTSSIRVGVSILPEHNPAEDGRWADAERLGFAHAWTFDHLAWRALADSPWYATVPTLAAAALSTRAIPVGVFVASPNFRHPVTFAKELMTLDAMSGGRLQVGIGAGGTGYDAFMLGQPELGPRQRMDRFTEFVTMLDELLGTEHTTRSGEWFSAVDARTIPLPVQRPRPPFVVAANGPRGMRLALQHGQGWATTGIGSWGADPAQWWQGVGEAVRRFRQVAERVEDDPTRLGWYLDAVAGAGPLTSVEKTLDDVGRARDLGFTDIVLPWPRRTEPFAGTVDVLEGVAATLTDGRAAP